MTDAEPVLQLKAVVKRFGRNTVLRGVDLTVTDGEVIALIGASGSGKSTLLRCCNGLEAVDSGTVTVFGLDLSDPYVHEDRVRQRIGMVFQSFNLFPHLSIIDNISLAPVRTRRVSRAEAVRSGHRLLDRFGLADKANEYPDRLSGGQQQRVAIIRALAMEPRIMLLDEVTSALDPELVGEVLTVLRELAATGMTMVLATHEMRFAREAAHRVCFLKEGAIVEQGTPVQMFTEPQHPETQQFLRRIIGD